jgi:hypothetical protein
MPVTGDAPRTLSQAATLIRTAPESLSGIFGLTNKGKIYQRILKEVGEAEEKILRPLLQGPPSPRP